MSLIKHALLYLAAATWLSASASPSAYQPHPGGFFVKQLVFPENCTIEEKVEMASRLVPSQKQLDWQKLELTAFIHFGVNTFTDREWGDGKEDPSIFNPDSLDTDQWVSTLKAAGFKMVMLTAKHHDGFCLWPTATTTHSVAASPWRDGKGDVVGMLAESCRKYGVKLGLYLSPWDRNAPCYGTDGYNDMFVAQLTELLTRYGKVDEVWFDGACGEGPNGKKQVYDWQRYKETIETLQPAAVVAIMGDDVRWVGNEKGLGRDTEWSATAFTPGILPGAAESNAALGLFPKAPDLGSREIIAKAEKLYWWPSEVDVSIRPGWFHHRKEAPHSLRRLANIYVNSVGKNSVLLLNIPPDTHGLIDSRDVERLGELRQWIDSNFSDDLAGQCAFSDTAPTVAVRAPFNTLVFGEDVSKGQRVEAFRVDALVDGDWQTVADGTTVGIKRIVMFDEVAADSVRLVFTGTRGPVNLAFLEAYNVAMPDYEAPTLPDGYAYCDKQAWTACVTDKTCELCSGKSEGSAGIDSCPKAAFDGDPKTVWQSAPGVSDFSVDMGSPTVLAGFSYTPRQDDRTEGMIFKYALAVSDDGAEWRTLPLSGEFSNIVNNPISQLVYFPAPVTARYFRLSATATADGSPSITIADLDALTPIP